MNATRVSVATAVSLALLAACTPGPVAPSPSPTPTAASTPAETQLERQTRLDYAAAEKAYRTWNAEYNRVLQTGGVAQPTEAMQRTAAGPFLESQQLIAAGFRKNDAKQVGTVKIGRLDQAGYSTTELLLGLCEDGSQVRYLRNGKQVSKGEVRDGVLTVRKIGGLWKMWSGKAQVVDGC